MVEDRSRSSVCKIKTTIAFKNQDAPLVNGNNEIQEMFHHGVMDPVVTKGVNLARDVVLHLLGENMCLLHADQISLCLRNSVVEILEKHAILFTSFAKRLARTPDQTSEAFVGVSDELFLNGCVTWNRIIALYAFAGRLALYFQENNMHKLAQNVPQNMTQSIAGKVAPFVRRSGGWVRVCCSECIL
jgi:BCL2-like 1 (apoptosis regulator Bcl-X)